MGDPMDPETTFGPLINDKAISKVSRLRKFLKSTIDYIKLFLLKLIAAATW